MSDKAPHKLYEGLDPENLDADGVTLCSDCAKHPSPKRFVELHAVDGPVCGVCQETVIRMAHAPPSATGDDCEDARAQL